MFLGGSKLKTTIRKMCINEKKKKIYYPCKYAHELILQSIEIRGRRYQVKMLAEEHKEIRETVKCYILLMLIVDDQQSITILFYL